MGRPPQFCGEPACSAKAYEKIRYHRQNEAATKARAAKAEREQARQFAETQKMHNDMRKRVSEAIALIEKAVVKEEGTALRAVLPSDGALITVLNPKERSKIVQTFPIYATAPSRPPMHSKASDRPDWRALSGVRPA